MDDALRDEGFESVGSHAVFVRWQRVSVETLGRILGEAEALFDKSRGEGEAERRRIERMIEAGSNALAMAHQATEKARLASVHSEEAIDESIARIAKEMSRALLAESQKWLVLKQTARNRREAWRLSAWVCAGALAIFIGGSATMGWWNGKTNAARESVIEAVDHCWVEPMMVRMEDGKSVEACRLADLTPGRPK
jgi:hypothetical protein